MKKLILALMFSFAITMVTGSNTDYKHEIAMEESTVTDVRQCQTRFCIYYSDGSVVCTDWVDIPCPPLAV